MGFLIAIVVGLTVSKGFVERPSCALTPADKIANAALSFDDFDQKGTLPSTARALSERDCMNEAVAAAEDYLLNGPPRTDYQQRIIMWHMAQHLALAGEELQAAHLMAATRVPTGNNDNIDWNTYVKATRAFLVKDRKAFDTTATTLASSGRESDQINRSIVMAMGRCWMKPYRLAYNANCGK